MFWVAIEDADTHEVSEFAQATEKQVHKLITGHKADTRDAMRFCLRDVEDGSPVVYNGVIYKGGFGYNIWAAKKNLNV